MKRIWNVFLAIFLVFGCTAIPASAAEAIEPPGVVFRASGRINYSISAKSTISLGDDFYLDKNETISYDCTYTPKAAGVDFGYIDSNNVFHYLNCTSGSIDQSFAVSQTGQYTLAIRNNASYAVTVTGTVKY